jgi:hypothetical protein
MGDNGQMVNGWWDRASFGERIAHVKGGIECGMTWEQIAMNCGAKSPRTVMRYCTRLGIIHRHNGRGTGFDIEKVGQASALWCDGSTAEQIADCLKIDKGQVLGLIHADRSSPGGPKLFPFRNDERISVNSDHFCAVPYKVWEKAYRREKFPSGEEMNLGHILYLNAGLGPARPVTRRMIRKHVFVDPTLALPDGSRVGLMEQGGVE